MIQLSPGPRRSWDLQVSGISQVNDLLRDAGGLVKIEDLLPLFPDFVTIDAFREAIHESLEQYSAHIDQLKQEMSDATRIADALRLNGCLVSWVWVRMRVPVSHTGASTLADGSSQVGCGPSCLLTCWWAGAPLCRMLG